MKNIGIFVLLAAIAAVGSAFAADTAPVTKTIVGDVVAFAPAVAAVPADTVKNTAAVAAVPAQLTVAVAKVNTVVVFDAKTVVTGKDKKAVDPATLKAGTKVSVVYAEAGKVLTAVSVTVQ